MTHGIGGLAVIAVGGNSLIKDNDHQSAADQSAAAAETSRHIAHLIEEGWDVVITHGNGPQVGFQLLRSEMARKEVPEDPLDYCGASTQGSIGYLFQQALSNEFRRRGIKRPVITVVTRVVVDPDDPAFKSPSKPVGPFYDEARAKRRAQQNGWSVVEDAGRGWRRVVPSPQPQQIVELEVIQALLYAGTVVIAVGGGGIPVVSTPDGSHEGVAAVIDKDVASSRLATLLGADLLLISTAVERVCLRFGQPDQQALDRVTLPELQRWMSEGHFKAGSMLPKMKAIQSYLEGGGKRALVTLPELIPQGVAGNAGTTFVP